MYFYVIKIYRTYKYKLRPNKAQRQALEQILGCCRFLYNIALEERILHYQSTRKGIGYYHQQYQLKELFKTEGFEYMKCIPAQARQDVLKRLDKTYTSFFKGGGFPKWAKRGKYSSFTLPQHVKFDSNKIIIPKVGKMSMFCSRTIPKDATIKFTTFKKQADGWFACVTFEVDHIIPTREIQAVGIDMGVNYFAVTSDGVYFDNPKHLVKHQRRLKVLQRKLARQNKGGSNWCKTKHLIAKTHLKITNTRKDFLHKISNQLTNDYSLICVEDLKLKNLTKSAKGNAENPGSMVKQKSGLNRSLLDLGIGYFFTFLDYKSVEKGGKLIKVNPRNTSRKCNSCGHISKNNRISQSKFECESCGHTDNADHNASKNIMGDGIALSRQCTTAVAA